MRVFKPISWSYDDFTKLSKNVPLYFLLVVSTNLCAIEKPLARKELIVTGSAGFEFMVTFSPELDFINNRKAQQEAHIEAMENALSEAKDQCSGRLIDFTEIETPKDHLKSPHYPTFYTHFTLKVTCLSLNSEMIKSDV